MKTIFIAGTDTGVGKTVVTGLLARHISEKGYRVVTQKWVSTGPEKDRGIHPIYKFRLAASPHLAARLEGKKVEKARIKKSLDILSENFDFVIVEGTGGLLVPLDSRILLIDLVKEFAMPVILVAANRVGTINHTLLSIEALKKRKIKIAGIIFNDISKDVKKVILKDNPEITKKFQKVKVLGRLPRERGRRKLQKRFAVLGDKVLAGV